MSTQTTPRRAADVEPLVVMKDVGKSYGNVNALQGVNLEVYPGEVTCVLGDNGAGKSTLIKIMAGLHEHTTGTFEVNRVSRNLASPRAAQALGIATVYQDLALAPLMSVWRNFFMGNELRKGPFLDAARMRSIADEELQKMGIHIGDLDRPVGGLSGGQKQCIAIARAIYFGAKVIILDEPTAALGVKQSGVVLKYIAKARRRSGSRLHHPQPAPRLPRGQPLPHPQARPAHPRRPPRRADARPADGGDGRRAGARRAQARAR